MNCNCNNKDNRLTPPKIVHVQGNVLRLAIPLTLRTIELVDVEVDGEIQQQTKATDSPFTPSSDYPVMVVLSKGAVKVSFKAQMRDGNIAYTEDKGTIPVGTYDITVTCNDNHGNPYRFKQSTVLQVFDTTAQAGIETPIEYEVTTWYLDAAIYLALKGEDGVGIEDIETQSSGEIGGMNTVTIVLTNGETRSFTVMNGAGSVDEQLDPNSPNPIANKAVTARFNELADELAGLFGDVDYDTQSKSIRFWDKGKTSVLASLDARPFIKDGMVNNVYISNNTLVITFNTDSGREAIGVPLSSVFNPNNYYTRTQVDSRISSYLTNYYTKTQTDSRIWNAIEGAGIGGQFVVTITKTVELDDERYSADKTANQIYEAHQSGKNVIAKYGDSVGQLLYCESGNIVFLFAEIGDGLKTPLLVCNDDLWWVEEQEGGAIEIDDNPTADSGNAVSSGGTYLALSQKVSGIRVNNGNTQFPDNGIVNLNIPTGGYTPPIGGIPKTDLASGVQASLNKADTALQQSDLDGYATTDDVDNAVAALVSSAPQTLDTLKELADALGDDPNFATTMATQLDNKVDKETGRGLSTNDYTTAEKQKLAGIEAGATANVGTVTGVSINGQQAVEPQNGIVYLTFSGGGENDIVGISVPTPNDGTVIFTKRNGDNVVVNLNHIHPQYVESSDLASVATSGSYNDLTDKPTIPSLSGYVKFWTGTQAQYEALAPNYDSDTLYLIPETT